MSIQEKVCIRVLGSMIGYAAAEITKFDEDFKNKLEGYEEVIQWKIGDDIAYYTTIKDKTITSGDGIAANPTITLEIDDVSEALNVLIGKSDMSALIGKINIIGGDPQKLLTFSLIMQTVREYLEDLMNQEV